MNSVWKSFTPPVLSLKMLTMSSSARGVFGLKWFYHSCVRDVNFLLKEKKTTVRVEGMAEHVTSMVSSLITFMGDRPNDPEKKLDSTRKYFS